MKTVKVEEVVEAPIEQVWASWDRFGEVARFHPGIKASRLLAGSNLTGLGAQRQCDLSEGGKQFVRERIVAYEPPHRMVIDIFEASVPIKSATATLKLAPIGTDRTKVSMTMAFKPGLGPLGLLLGPMMKLQFKSMLGKVLKSNGMFVTKGIEVAR